METEQLQAHITTFTTEIIMKKNGYALINYLLYTYCLCV